MASKSKIVYFITLEKSLSIGVGNTRNHDFKIAQIKKQYCSKSAQCVHSSVWGTLSMGILTMKLLVHYFTANFNKYSNEAHL